MKGIFKKLGRVTALACVLALVAAILPVGLFEAKAATPVEKTEVVGLMADEYGWPTDIVYKTKNVAIEGGMLTVNTSYPTFIARAGEEGSEELMAKLNKAMYKSFYKEIVEGSKTLCELATAAAGISVDYVANCEFYDYSRQGNIFSISAEYSITLGEYGKILDTIIVQNFNLHTGKRIQSFDKIFKNVPELKKAIIEEIKAQIAEIEEGILPYEWRSEDDAAWTTLEEGLDIAQISFNLSGGTIYIPIALILDTADPGCLAFSISKDTIAKYIKNDRRQLIDPKSSYVFEFEENASTGYTWQVNRIVGDDCFQMLGTMYKGANTMMTGVPGTRYYYGRAIAPGECRLLMSYYDHYGDPVENIQVYISVDEDLAVRIWEYPISSQDPEKYKNYQVEPLVTLQFMPDEEGNFSEWITDAKTISYETGSIEVSATYPQYVIDEENSPEDAVNAVYKACRKAFYTEVIKDAKAIYDAQGFKEVENTKLKATSQFMSQGRHGNIYSITEYIVIEGEDGTVYKEDIKSVNIDLLNKKRITSLSSIFEDVDEMKDEMINSFKIQVENLRSEEGFEEGVIKENIDWDAVKKNISIDNVSFDMRGMVYRTGYDEIFVNPETYMNLRASKDTTWCYVKTKYNQLINPLSEVLLEMGVDPEAGEYYWEYLSESEYVQPVSVAAFDNTLLAEDSLKPEVDIYLFKALKPGDTTLKFALLDQNGEVIIEQSQDITILDNMAVIYGDFYYSDDTGN